MHRLPVTLLVYLLLGSVGLAGQTVSWPSRAECSPLKFQGQISRGGDFETPVSLGLLFRLRAGKDPLIDGWTIEIRSRTLPEPHNEFSWVATPPYRSWNPRYIQNSYGWTAQQAVEMNEREFSFVLNDADFEKTVKATRVRLWPSGHSAEEIALADRVWVQVKVGGGKLTILESKLGPVDAKNDRGTIEWIRFKVELCIPSQDLLAMPAHPPAKEAKQRRKPVLVLRHFGGFGEAEVRADKREHQVTYLELVELNFMRGKSENRTFAAGERLELSAYLAEGSYFARYKGEYLEIFGGDLRILRETEEEVWVQLKYVNGKSGWVKVDDKVIQIVRLIF